LANPPPKIRWTVFAVLALLAFAARLPQLGERPMHTDESVNAYLTGEILAGEPFHYDPRDRHGPALFMLAGPLARMLGAKNFADLTETQLRLTPVLTGTLTVFLFGSGVEMFGFTACVVGALLFAFAPLPLYYSRYFIHETLFVAATLGLILSLWRALETKSVLPAAVAGFCAALMLAVKETCVIHFFALGIAALAFKWTTPKGIRAPVVKPILAASVVFLLTVLLLFTWFGRNWQGLADLFRAIPSFTARAGGEGHEKPVWYYAQLLANGPSNMALSALAALGLGFAIFDSARRKEFGAQIFISIYAVVIAVIYGVIPYKTPWLALNFWLPMALLIGVAVARILEKARTPAARWSLVFPAILLAGVMARDIQKRVFQFPAAEDNPYAYAHTGGDLLRLPARLAELAKKENLAQPLIAVVAADAWPLPWYLRKFPRTGFWQPGQDTGAADFFITSPEAAEKLGDKLKNCRPEFFGVRPEVLMILWVPASKEKSP
jgi:uncharacterized protein (TIGR03663 family)